MRKFILIIAILFVSLNCISQDISSIKHIEVVSEICDSMVLLNKQDIDKINQVFYKASLLDSLNKTNTQIIENLKEKTSYLDSILIEENKIKANQQQLIFKMKEDIDQISDVNRRLIRKEQNKKIFWQSTTGVCMIVIIIIAII